MPFFTSRPQLSLILTAYPDFSHPTPPRSILTSTHMSPTRPLSAKIPPKFHPPLKSRPLFPQTSNFHRSFLTIFPPNSQLPDLATLPGRFIFDFSSRGRSTFFLVPKLIPHFSLSALRYSNSASKV